ncbi:MAG: S-ribosylhomocysteine lyase [Clostridia bacterium]|nr:S-ribosylhomocysteine lyase [Clostridia bacterium]
MKKITSFTVDHRFITEGIYISRIDGDVTTYDLRTKKPNSGDYMDNETMHTFEHMFATFVRNSEIADDVLYFGPMGCQTGFYLLVRNADNEIVRKIVCDILKDIIDHNGEVFGNSEIECGNYKTLNLEKAKREAKCYLDCLSRDNNNFIYPKGEEK